MGGGAVERLLDLERFERSGMRPGLERIQALLADLGHPESTLRILHVGGTNGKGSVSALAEAILRAAGWRTGLYTSPHLLGLAERVRLDGAPIGPEALARAVAPLESRLLAGGITFFEAMTAVALAAFREARVDVAVLEVGLGGRWDATNVGAPLVSVITRLDLDHQEVLGPRLADIAAEKAAIIRGGVALSAAQAPEAMAVVEARCREIGAPLLVEGRELHGRLHQADRRGLRLDLRGPGWSLDDVWLALPGLFQATNAVLAAGAARVLATAAGSSVSDEAVREGCAAVRWPGRFQVVDVGGRAPLLVLDGAHNPAGARALAASLTHAFPGARLTLVLGVSADKDRAGILEALAPLARRVYLTAAASARAARPADLLAAVPPVDAEVRTAPDVSAALDEALAQPDADVVCVAGSLFLVADALRWLEEGSRLLEAARLRATEATEDDPTARRAGTRAAEPVRPDRSASASPGRGGGAGDALAPQAPRVLAEASAAETEYRVGVASWMDRALIASGRFYPRVSMTAEQRLRWYARVFDTVEVNSTYYALPDPRVARAWVERTPPGFLFHVKAYGLMTGHHPRLHTLPAPLRAMLPEDVPLRPRGEVDRDRFPPEALELCFALFREALAPLAEAGKLGYVLFQLAPWVRHDESALAYLASLRARLPGIALAVEVRHESWVPRRTEEVLAFLARHGLAFVAVDAPWQPLLPAVTAPGWAVLRLHGKNVQGWLDQLAGRAPTVAEKYDYLYGAEECAALADQARAFRGHARRVAVTFNNNNEDYPARNALDVKRLLGLETPDLEILRAAWRPEPRARPRGPAVD